MIDAYKIGITLTVNNAIFGELNRLISQFQNVNNHVRNTNSSLGGTTTQVNALKRAADGLAATFGRIRDAAGSIKGAMGDLGVGGLQAARHSAEQAMKPAFDQRHAELNLKFTGASAAEVAGMRAKAEELARTKGDQSVSGYLHMQGVVYGATQDAKKTTLLAGVVADFQTSMAAITGKPLSDQEIQDAIKTIEARRMLLTPDGQINVAGVTSELSLMAAVAQKTHGQVTPSTFRNFVNQTGASTAAGMSAEAFYGYGAEYANAMGGHRAGTAIMAMTMQLRAGIMTQRTMEAMLKNGWINTHDANGKLLLEKDANGNVKLLPGALKDAEGFQKNPYLWISKGLDEAVEHRNKNNPGRPVTRDDVVFDSFGRQTSIRGAAEIDALIGILVRFAGGLVQLVQEHPLHEAAAERRKKDPEVVLRGFTSAWTDFVAAVGDPAVDPALSALQGMGRAVREWSDWAKANPEQVREIGQQVAAIGGTTLALGALAASLGLLSKASLLFVVGGAAQLALEKLTGKQGLEALSEGLKGLSAAFDTLPSWLISAAIGTMAGARLGGVPGAVIGGGLGAAAPGLAGVVGSHDPNWGTGPGAVEARKRQQAEMNAWHKLGPLEKLKAWWNGQPTASAPPARGAAPLFPPELLGNALGASPGAASPVPALDRAEFDKLMGIGGGALPPALQGLLPGGGGGADPAVRKQSFVPPGGGRQQVQVENVMFLDGDVVHRSVTRRMVRAGSLPSASFSGFDGRRTPRMGNAPMPA